MRSVAVDVDRVREHLTSLVYWLSQTNRHKDLPNVCQLLTLPEPPDDGSKAERMAASLASAPDAELPEVARRLLTYFPPAASARNGLEEVLWRDDGSPRVPEGTVENSRRSSRQRTCFLTLPGSRNFSSNFGCWTTIPSRYLQGQTRHSAHVSSAMCLGIQGT